MARAARTKDEIEHSQRVLEKLHQHVRLLMKDGTVIEGFPTNNNMSNAGGVVATATIRVGAALDKDGRLIGGHEVTIDVLDVATATPTVPPAARN